MGALGDKRRKLRIMSLENAATMISEHFGGGASPEELGLTEKEFYMLEEENQRTANILMQMAEKLKKDDE